MNILWSKKSDVASSHAHGQFDIFNLQIFQTISSIFSKTFEISIHAEGGPHSTCLRMRDTFAHPPIDWVPQFLPLLIVFQNSTES